MQTVEVQRCSFPNVARAIKRRLAFGERRSHYIVVSWLVDARCVKSALMDMFRGCTFLERGEETEFGYEFEMHDAKIKVKILIASEANFNSKTLTPRGVDPGSVVWVDHEVEDMITHAAKIRTAELGIDYWLKAEPVEDVGERFDEPAAKPHLENHESGATIEGAKASGGVARGDGLARACFFCEE